MFELIEDVAEILIDSIIDQQQSAAEAASFAQALRDNNSALVHAMSDIVRQAFVQSRLDEANDKLRTLASFMVDYSNNTADFAKLELIEEQCGFLIDTLQNPDIGLSGFASFMVAASLRIQAFKLKAATQPGDMVNAKEHALSYASYAIAQLDLIYTALSARVSACSLNGGVRWTPTGPEYVCLGLYNVDGNQFETPLSTYIPPALPDGWPGTVTADEEQQVNDAVMDSCNGMRMASYRDMFAHDCTVNTAVYIWTAISYWRGLAQGWSPDCAKVAFKTATGFYLTADGGGGGLISASARVGKDWSAFYMIQLEKTKHVFVTYNGNTIQADQGGEHAVGAWYWNASDWEEMSIVTAPHNKVALQVADGKYISPQQGGGGIVAANGPAVGAWEVLELVRL